MLNLRCVPVPQREHSESMAFGKPKKVGMPKRNKKAVAVADYVPVTEGITAVAAEPPSSQPPKAQDCARRIWCPSRPSRLACSSRSG